MTDLSASFAKEIGLHSPAARLAVDFVVHHSL